jgi:hypothetical protein
MIQKYHLAGYHALITEELYNNTMEREGLQDPYMIPHYIIIDKKGQVGVFNAARPGSREALFEQIDALL